MGYTVEMIRRIYDDEEGVCLEIRPDQDGLGTLEIHTPDKKSSQWFGEVRFSISHEMAEKLGMALISASKDKDKE